MYSSKEADRRSEELSPNLVARRDIGFYNETDWDKWAHYVESAFTELDNEEYIYRPIQIKDNHKKSVKLVPTIERHQQRCHTMMSQPNKILETGTSDRKGFLPILTPKTTPAARQSTSGYNILPNRHIIPNLSKFQSVDKPQFPKLAAFAKSLEVIEPSLREKYLHSQKLGNDLVSPIKVKFSENNSKSSTPRHLEARKTFSGLSLNVTPLRAAPRKTVGTPLKNYSPSGYTKQLFVESPPSKHSTRAMSSRCDSTRKTLSVGGSVGDSEWRSDGRVSRKGVSSARDMTKYSMNPSNLDKTFKKIEKDFEMPVKFERFLINKSVLNSSKSKKSPKAINLRKTTSQIFPNNSNPLISINDALAQLESDDWEENVESFRSIVNIARQNSENIRPHLHRINIAGLKHVTNSRSQVSRIACRFFEEMFTTFGRAMEHDIEKLAEKLLEKSADTNKFIREDAWAALEMMAESLPPNRTLLAIDTIGTKHRNGLVRTTTAGLTELIIKRLGAERVLSEFPDRILPMLASFLQEGSLETRKYAKEGIAQIVAQRNFESLLRRHVNAEILRNVTKTIVAVKQEVIGQCQMPS